MGKTIITARRHYPNLFTLEGELDVPEVDNTIRNAWLSIYTLQQDVIDTKDFLEDAVDRGEISADGSSGATEIVRQTTIQTIIGSPAAGVELINAQSNRLPFINTALQLDGGNNAPEYDPSSKALTIRGAANITGAITGLATLDITGAVTFLSTLDVTGAVTLLSTLDVTGATTLLSTLDVTGLITSDGGILIDADLAEAFLVRQDGDGGDVFAVNTLTQIITVTGAVTVSGTYTGQGAMLLDVDDAEAFLVRQDGDGGDVFAINTLTSLITVTGDQTVSGFMTVVGDVTIDDGNAELLSDDLGNDVIAKSLTIGRNSNVGPEGGSPGVLELISADGTSCFLWCKNDGQLSIGPAQPTGSTGTPTVPSEIGGFVLAAPNIKSFTFRSPAGGAGTFFVGGDYDWSGTDANLNQGPPASSLFVVHGTALHPYGAHAAIVAGGPGTASGGAGTVEIEVSGTSIALDGTRTASDTEILVADVTALALDQYIETIKFWIGQVTFTIQNSGGSTHTTFSADFNYGFVKYQDFDDNNAFLESFEFTGIAGANDTIFNVELLHHTDQGWTYAATGFVPGNPAFLDYAADYGAESDTANTVAFAYLRTEIDTLINVAAGEGLLVRVTTGSNNTVSGMDIHISGLFT